MLSDPSDRLQAIVTRQNKLANNQRFSGLIAKFDADERSLTKAGNLDDFSQGIRASEYWEPSCLRILSDSGGNRGKVGGNCPEDENNEAGSNLQ